MIVFQNTNTHTFVSRDFFKLGYIDIIDILHPYRFLIRMVSGTFFHNDRNISTNMRVCQLALIRRKENGPSARATSCFLARATATPVPKATAARSTTVR